MKVKSILAISALALLAACGKSPEVSGSDQTSEAATEVKAVAGTYALDKTHAALIWSIPHLGLSNYTARFASFDARLTLDPGDIGKSSVVLTINPASVRTDYSGDYRGTHPDNKFKSWDEQIALSPDFLDGGKAREITFTSTKVEQTGPRTAKVTGDLAFRGQTRPVTLDATIIGAAESHPFRKIPAVGFSAEGSFKPSEFGVGLLGGVLGDEVKVRFDGEFIAEQKTGDETQPAAS